jgi:hypothetical protein
MTAISLVGQGPTANLVDIGGTQPMDYGFAEFFDSYSDISNEYLDGWTLIKGTEQSFHEQGMDAYTVGQDWVSGGALIHTDSTYVELTDGDFAMTSTYYSNGRYMGMVQYTFMDQGDGNGHIYAYDNSGNLVNSAVLSVPR